MVSFTCEEAVSINQYYTSKHIPARRGAAVGSRTRHVAYAVDAPRAKHEVFQDRPGLVRGQRVALLTAVVVAESPPWSTTSSRVRCSFIYLFIFDGVGDSIQ